MLNWRDRLRAAKSGHSPAVLASQFDLTKFHMQAELRSLFSPTLPAGSSEAPDNPHDCWVVMQADIGDDYGESADIFTFYVTTPAFLERTLDGERCEMGRGLMVVKRFDWTVVEKLVKEICTVVRGDSWDVLA